MMTHYDPSKSYVMNSTKVIEGETITEGSPVPVLPRHTLELFLQHRLIREGVAKTEQDNTPAQATITKADDGHYVVTVGGMPIYKTENKAKKSAIEYCEKENLTYIIS